jgi:hypothetical protein
MDDVRTYSVTSEKYERLPDLEEKDKGEAGNLAGKTKS